eukprot:TRINITY_DN2258_c2_g1_i1.p1 TRINITY_DN2258_c2_g1~~TRINITY_DN2258_c2_g1_i1.p1  ORF type:complete len:411 (+),score=62.34 TRINITY_DN2258_c2_g1_i1:148-1380(+)
MSFLFKFITVLMIVLSISLGMFKISNNNDNLFKFFFNSSSHKTIKSSQILDDIKFYNTTFEYFINNINEFKNESSCKIGRGKPPQIRIDNNIIRPLYQKAFHKIHFDINHIDGKYSNDLDFFSRYLSQSKPVVIHNSVNDWNAFKNDNWKSDSYLSNLIGENIVTVERSNSNEFGHQTLEDPEIGWGFYKFSFNQFLERYLKKITPTTSHWYLDNQLEKELEEDIKPHSFIPCMHQTSLPYYSYKNMWMGGGEEISLQHNDLEDNIITLIDGYKTVYLVEPTTKSEYMYEDYDNELTETKLSAVDITKDDDYIKEHFPLFYENVSPIRVDLKPGDALFIPSMWWHQVKSNCRSIAYNIWFDTFNIKQKGTDFVFTNPTSEVFKDLKTHSSLCNTFHSTKFIKYSNTRENN